MMKPSTKDQVEGELRELKVKIKGALGKATSDANLEVTGKRKSKLEEVNNGSAVSKKPLRNSGRIKRDLQITRRVAMSEAVGERTADYVAESAAQAYCATTAMVDAIHDGIGSVRTAVKRGGDAAEELLNDTTERIQRHPVLTVAATFAVGLTAGTLIGWFMKRR